MGSSPTALTNKSNCLHLWALLGNNWGNVWGNFKRAKVARPNTFRVWGQGVVDSNPAIPTIKSMAYGRVLPAGRIPEGYRKQPITKTGHTQHSWRTVRRRHAGLTFAACGTCVRKKLAKLD